MARKNARSPIELESWLTYYEATSGREPRPLLLTALERFNEESSAEHDAIDLGAGDGTDTEELLRRGWSVLAIDGEPMLEERLAARIPAPLRTRLRVKVAGFEELDALPSADLVWSGLSLPFCPPEAFPRLWGVAKAAIRPGGRIACDLFGDRDTWADDPAMTFVTAAEAEALFDGLELEQFEERDEDGEAVTGSKHWHVFSVIARKST